MSFKDGLPALGLAAVLALGLTAPQAQAWQVSKWNCPTGQTKNPLTALCEGEYTGAFIYVAPGYDGPDEWGHHHHWWRHHHHAW